MSRCQMFIKSAALLSLVMLFLTHASTVPIKVTEEYECCTATSNRPITTPITGCWFQKAEGSCVNAVILSSEGQEYCISLTSSWVRFKIKELRRKKMSCPLKKLNQQRTVVLSTKH